MVDEDVGQDHGAVFQAGVEDGFFGQKLGDVRAEAADRAFFDGDQRLVAAGEVQVRSRLSGLAKRVSATVGVRPRDCKASAALRASARRVPKDRRAAILSSHSASASRLCAKIFVWPGTLEAALARTPVRTWIRIGQGLARMQGAVQLYISFRAQ